MNKCFFLKKEDRTPKWHFIDAKDMVLGRLATKATNILRGKDKVEFSPHVDCGDYVVITNCEKIKLTGNKLEDKIYRTHSGWMGGKKERTAKEVMQRDPARIIQHAVKGMLPKNKLSRQIIKKLKVYAGSEHPHEAQKNTK
ncbi:MAG: 50S ribosomal protein L13 [bacterium]